MKIGFVYPHSIFPTPSVHLFDAITIVTYELSRRLSWDHEVTVYARRVASEPDHDSFQGVHLKRLSLGFDKILSGLKVLRSLGIYKDSNPIRISSLYYRLYAERVAADVAARQLDVVHIHSIETFIPIIRRRAPKACIVLHCHDHALCDYYCEKTRDRIAQAAMILGCSDYVCDNIKRLYPETAARCFVFHNGVNESFLGVEQRPHQKRRVMFAGRLSPEKGVHVLLEAFSRIASSHSEAELELVGPAHVAPRVFVDPHGTDPVFDDLEGYFERPQTYFSSLKALAGKSERVEFAGAVANEALPGYYAEADVFAFPSLWQEPFGIPVIEAMAAGLPVVATHAGAFPETVADGVTGLLVERGDVGALASALERLVGDPELGSRMGAAGRSRVKGHFLWDQQADRLTELYCQALSCGAQRVH